MEQNTTSSNRMKFVISYIRNVDWATATIIGFGGAARYIIAHHY